jgi:hypothetical protein
LSLPTAAIQTFATFRRDNEDEVEKPSARSLSRPRNHHDTVCAITPAGIAAAMRARVGKTAVALQREIGRAAVSYIIN